MTVFFLLIAIYVTSTMYIGYCFVLQFKSTSMEGKVKFNFQCGAIKLYMPCVTR